MYTRTDMNICTYDVQIFFVVFPQVNFQLTMLYFKGPKPDGAGAKRAKRAKHHDDKHSAARHFGPFLGGWGLEISYGND